MKIYLFLIKFYIFTSFCQAQSPPYGQLKIQGRFLTDSQGNTVQLRGMSFFPLDYIGYQVADYFNEAAIHQIKCAWNANVVRAPTMPKEDKVGGWMTDKDRDYSRLKKVIDAAIKEGIYVIVDWHAFTDPHIDGAKDFFANISKTYGSFPNIIYEIWNEPDGENGTWPLVKEYAEEIIDIIRQNDPNNIIVVGTPNWSQRVDQAAQDPINLTNIAYTLHYYAATHGQPIRDIALTAINKDLPIFITEYGTVTSTGAGPMNESEANLWWEFDDKYQLSYVNWAIQNNSRSDANCCIQNTTADQLGDPSFWAPSGKLVNKKLRSTNQGVDCNTCSCPSGAWYQSSVNPCNCYNFIKTPKDWTSANNDCQQQDPRSMLASIDSTFENNEVLVNGQNQTSCTQLFIGLQEPSTNVWAWINNDTSTYRNWKSGYPDGNANNKCSQLNTSDGKWTNIDCSTTGCYVCEIKIN